MSIDGDPVPADAFAAFTDQGSGCASWGVERDGRRWFVKTARTEVGFASLGRAMAVHAAVRHPAIVAPVHVVDEPGRRTLTMPWHDGEVLNAATVTGGSDRSGLRRFLAEAPTVRLVAVDRVLDAHLAVADAGFVAVDLYDGCLLWDRGTATLRLIDLDEYRPGPFTTTDRLPGSRRYQAPEELGPGQRIDERTTVFTLGRLLGHLVGDVVGEEQAAVLRAATDPERTARPATVEELVARWRSAPVRRGLGPTGTILTSKSTIGFAGDGTVVKSQRIGDPRWRAMFEAEGRTTDAVHRALAARPVPGLRVPGVTATDAARATLTLQRAPGIALSADKWVRSLCGGLDSLRRLLVALDHLSLLDLPDDVLSVVDPSEDLEELVAGGDLDGPVAAALRPMVDGLASARPIAHGDPVARNVLRDGDDLWLLDWEHAARRAPGYDAAVLWVTTAELDGGRRVVVDHVLAADEAVRQSFLVNALLVSARERADRLGRLIGRPENREATAARRRDEVRLLAVLRNDADWTTLADPPPRSGRAGWWRWGRVSGGPTGGGSLGPMTGVEDHDGT